MFRALISVQMRAVGEKATLGKKSNIARNKGEKKSEGRKEPEGEVPAEVGEIRYFLPMLTTVSHAHSLMLGRRWHPTAPQGAQRSTPRKDKLCRQG